MATSEEVLSSFVYNPVTDNKTLSIYSTMNSNDEALLAEYTELASNMSENNPYAGAIYNPRACECDLASTMASQVLQALAARNNSIISAGTATQTYVPSEQQISEANQWRTLYPQVQSNMNSSISVISAFKSHTNRNVANMPSIIGLAQGNISSGISMGNIPSNPCLQFGDMLGSIMDAGAKIIDKILSALQTVMGVVGDALQAIMNAVSGLMQAIAQAMTMITNELAKMAEAMLNSAKMGLASLLSYMPNDPCLSSILSGVMTTAAKSALG